MTSSSRGWAAIAAMLAWPPATRPAAAKIQNASADFWNRINQQGILAVDNIRGSIK